MDQGIQLQSISPIGLILAGFAAGASLTYLLLAGGSADRKAGQANKQNMTNFDTGSSASDSEASIIDTNRDVEPCKLVLIIRTDLGMSKGKVAAQCCHATLACYKAAARSHTQYLDHWEYEGQAKITLKCNSEGELLELQTRAHSLGLIGESIQDAGRTQIAAGSRTVLGIGPAPIALVDEVTKHLKLY